MREHWSGNHHNRWLVYQNPKAIVSMTSLAWHSVAEECFAVLQEEAKKVEARLSRLTLPTLHTFMDILDISRGSDTKVRDGTHRFFHLPRPATWKSNSNEFVDDNCRSKWTNEHAQITLCGG